jgi:hypothetical protein
MAAREQRGRSGRAAQRFALRARRIASRRRAAGAVLALLVAVLTAVLASAAPSPARAHGESGPVAVAAFGADGGTETAVATVPGLGNAAVQTDQLPATATQATVEVARTAGDAKAFDGLVDVVISSFPKLAKANRTAKRIIACAFIASLKANPQYVFTQVSATEADPTLEALLLAACIQIALSLPVQHAPDASISASTCHRVDSAIAIKITATSSGYRGQVNARTHKPSHLAPVTVACQRTATGLALTIRPSAAGHTLVQAVGPNLGIAFVNRSSKPVSVGVSFVVH